MIRVVPVPRLAAIVVILENPLEPFYVCLPDVLTEFFELIWPPYQKLFAIVSLLPAFLGELDFVFPCTYLLVLLLMDLLFNHLFQLFSNEVCLIIFRETLKFVFENLFGMSFKLIGTHVLLLGIC